MWLRLIYALESEFAIVNSTYYYVGLERQSVQALKDVNLDELRHDTAQYLKLSLCNVNAGGFITEGSDDEVYQEEVEYLTRCLNISQRHHYPYFEGKC